MSSVDTAPIKILVVDDDVSHCTILQALLRGCRSSLPPPLCSPPQPGSRAMSTAVRCTAPSAAAAITAAHAADKTDEFIPASVIGDYAGMKDGDGLLCFNFRADRAREISAALLDKGFDGFSRARVPQFGAADFSCVTSCGRNSGSR